MQGLGMQLKDGKLLGAQLPAEFEDRISDMIAANIKQNNDQGVLEALKTKSSAMDSTLSEDGKKQIGELMGQLSDMNAAKSTRSTKSASLNSASMIERAQKILNSKVYHTRM